MESLTPVPCSDCINIHGDSPSSWLRNYPLGAEYRPDLKAYLCDGCADERRECFNTEPDPYDMPPYSDPC
jgi:hypothetical protein